MKPIALREVYGQALAKLGDNDNIVVLDADLSKATRTALFAEKYPERFFNIGIAEGDLIGTGAGLATCGKTVVVSTFAMFAAGRAYEQIRNSVAYPKLNVKIVATHGGVMIGEDGASHQCIEDISLMRTIPNMNVVVLSDQKMVYPALKQILELDEPVYVRMGRESSPSCYPDAFNFELGKGNVLYDGKDAVIFAIGDLVYEAVEARKALEKEGISLAVVDMHTIKPLDSNLIISYAERMECILTIEDHNVIGGLGSAICECLSTQNPRIVTRIGINDVFGESGDRLKLQNKYNLTSDYIVKKVKERLDIR